MAYMASAGAGFPPLEVRVGQAMSQGSGGMPPSPGATGAFPVSPGGHTAPSPAGFVQPGPASRFHGPRSSHVAHHPMHVDTHVTTASAYEPYKASYIWEPRHASFGQAILASDSVQPSAYETPHVLFPDERPVVIHLMAAEPRPAMNVTEITNQSLNLDLSEPRSVTVQNSFSDERTVQNSTEIPARIANMVFVEAPAAAPAAVILGGPIMARVA
ncbi:MAG: hypothetical protein C0405_05355 [Desulfovibrio sp.]|nr:hypothetical protein [Desulfovibrio sp.]